MIIKKGGAMKIFYHSADLDGHCSGAILYRLFPGAELFGINYGDEFPWGKIKKNEAVSMVDFSLQPFDDMERLNGIARLTWIDHHKTAIEEAHVRGFLASDCQVLEIGRGACELVWEYYTHEKNKAVELLGQYDVWNLIPGALELQQGLRLYDTMPSNTALWEKVFYDDVFLESLLLNGSIILKKQDRDNTAYAKACAFETDMGGMKVIAINKGLTNSQLFKSVYNKNKHDAMLTFVWRKGQWTVSLYSDHNNIDVSVICKANGGGGHKGAAGFQCDVLPFKLC